MCQINTFRNIYSAQLLLLMIVLQFKQVLLRKNTYKFICNKNENMFFFVFLNVCHFKNSPLVVFLAKDFLYIYIKFIGKHPCPSVISIKLQSNFIEITLRHGSSPVNLLYIFRATFLKNISGGLLLLFLNHFIILFRWRVSCLFYMSFYVSKKFSLVLW